VGSAQNVRIDMNDRRSCWHWWASCTILGP
jgi:hypothetical protein